MKKLLVLIVSFFVLTGCSQTDQTTDKSSQTVIDSNQRVAVSEKVTEDPCKFLTKETVSKALDVPLNKVSKSDFGSGPKQCMYLGKTDKGNAFSAHLKGVRNYNSNKQAKTEFEKQLDQLESFNQVNVGSFAVVSGTDTPVLKVRYKNVIFELSGYKEGWNNDAHVELGKNIINNL